MAMDEDGLLVVYGGKKRIADKIVQHFPRGQHCYVEPFFGGGGVYFAVPDGLYPVRVINDLNSGITTFFRVLRTRLNDLIRVCELTPYSLDEQRSCRDASGDPDPSTPDGELELARRVWVRQRQNFGGRQGAGAGWRRGTARMSLAAGTDNRLGQFKLFADKMRRVEINNTDAVELVKTYGKPDVFIYEDPPYVPETRTSNNDYAHEMSMEHHEKLVAATVAASEAGAKIMVSNYGNELYNRAYAGWRRVEFEHEVASTNFVSAEERTRTEVLWMNYPASEELRADWTVAVKADSSRERAILKHVRKSGRGR